MLIFRIEELRRIAQNYFNTAADAAEEINLATNMAESKSYQYSRNKIAGLSLLAHVPGYKDLDTFKGIKAWGALLAFDLRDSSKLAMKISPRDMYIVMHTYLPTMLKIIEKVQGTIVGMRGDGAIACFGLVQTGDDKPRVTQEQSEYAITVACDCGDAIVKAMRQVVNPILHDGKIKCADLLVGVGIDVGDVVATRIGLGEAHELTAYGIPVNQCCKRSFGNDAVVLTYKATKMFPKSKNGKTSFRAYPNKEDSYVLHYPLGYNTLA
jgi:hypothetical protein